MKKITILAVTLCFALYGSSQERYENREVTQTEKILGLSKLWEGVRNNFVYYDRLTFDWDSLYAVTIPRILDTKDTESYIQELEKMVAMVKDGHTFIMHNVNPPVEDRITPAPFTTKFVEGKVCVDKVWSSELIAKGVTKGIEIIAIDGTDVIEFGGHTLGQYIASSTPQWLHHKVFNNYELTKGKRTVPVNVEFYDGKKRFLLTIERNRRWDIQDEERSSGKSEEDDYETLKYRTLNKNVGLLTIRDFMDDSFIQIFDSLYSDILHSDALIIDLRDNAGGHSGKADYILQHLSSKPIRTSSWFSRMYIPAHASWGYPQEWYSCSSDYLMPAEKEIYDKPVMVLVNAGTFSSAEDFCVKFRGMKRGKLMGTPTGGSTGNGVVISLIKGVAGANICSKKDIAPDGTEFVGVGIIPDIGVNETKRSFMDKRDPVLEKAMSEL
jgi:Periplasmic protease